MYIYIYIYIYPLKPSGKGGRRPAGDSLDTSAANLRAKIPDFGGFDWGRILIFKGWNYHVHRESPGKLEPSNLSREILSREMGRRGHRRKTSYRGRERGRGRRGSRPLTC